MTQQNKKPQSAVAMRKGDYARALALAEKFNVRAEQRPYRKVKGVLKNALDFMETVAPLVKSGTAVETGSAWHGPDVFLDKKEAVALARSKDRADYLMGTFGLEIPQRDAKRLTALRRAFNLSSDKQAAGLAIRAYASVTDGLWRGNGFSAANQNAQTAAAASVQIDSAVEKVRRAITPGGQP